MIDTEENRAAVGFALTLLAAAHGREATAEMLLGYWDALEDLELEDVQAAAKALGRTPMEHMPRAPQVRVAAREARKERLQLGVLQLPPPITPWTDEQKAEADELRARMRRNLSGQRDADRDEEARARERIRAFAQQLAQRHGMAGGLGTDEVEV